MTTELTKLREALRRVKYEAVSLADAQVIALEALSASQPAQAGEVLKCQTCNGHGLVGGHMQDGSGYGEGCPDCNPEPAPLVKWASTQPAAQATPYQRADIGFYGAEYQGQATPEPSHAAKMLKADVAYVEQQMAAATPEPEWRDRLTVNLLRHGSGLTKNQIRALIDYAVDGIESDAALFAATPEPVGKARCSTCGVTMNEPHHPACGAVTAAIIGLNTMAAQDKEARRRELAEKIRETLRGVFTHPAPGVPEIDYQALIHAAWGAHKYAQGTGGCIAFKRGAEWFRDIALAAQAKGADHA